MGGCVIAQKTDVLRKIDDVVPLAGLRPSCSRDPGKGSSDDPAIGAQRLTVDLPAVRAHQEGDDVSNVARLAQPLQRGELGQVVDEFR
jgi:hypothetical protein